MSEGPRQRSVWASILADFLGWVVVVGTFGGVVYFIHLGFKNQAKQQEIWGSKLEQRLPELIDKHLSEFEVRQKDRYIKFHGDTQADIKAELAGGLTAMQKQLADALSEQASILNRIDTTTTDSDQNEQRVLDEIKSQTARSVAATTVVAKKVERKIVNPEDLVAEQRKNASLERQNSKLVRAKAVPVFSVRWPWDQPKPTPTPRHRRR